MRITMLSLLLSLLTLTTAADAAITASRNPGNSPTVTPYNGSQGSGFTISEDVAYDPSAGQWIKQLVNAGGGGIASGNRVSITETFTNTGQATWTDWHEEIISVTDIGGPQPGFLFDKDTLNVLVDDGGGFQALTEGVDYAVVPVDYLGPGSGNENMGWQAISIFFEPGSLIQTGNTLRIQKQLFEVFLDGNIWRVGEAAEIAQYPTVPEPSTFVLAAVCLAGLSYATLGRKFSRA